MEILLPDWGVKRSTRSAKTRPRGLEGRSVAIVDDNLDIPFTTRLETLLGERSGAKVQRVIKPSGTRFSPPELLDDVAARFDVAVVGIGL